MFSQEDFQSIIKNKDSTKKLSPYQKYKMLIDTQNKIKTPGKSRNVISMKGKQKAAVTTYSNIIAKKKHNNSTSTAIYQNKVSLAPKL